MRKLRLDFKHSKAKQLLVLTPYDDRSWMISRMRDRYQDRRPHYCASYARHCVWTGHGWFRMKVFQRVHGAADHDWPIVKKDPSRRVAAQRWNARGPQFMWQKWDTM